MAIHVPKRKMAKSGHAKYTSTEDLTFNSQYTPPDPEPGDDFRWSFDRTDVTFDSMLHSFDATAAT